MFSALLLYQAQVFYDDNVKNIQTKCEVTEMGTCNIDPYSYEHCMSSSDNEA